MGIRFDIFSVYPELCYGLSDKTDGPMGLAGDPELAAEKLQNKINFLSRFDTNIKQTVAAGLAHGINVAMVDKTHSGKIIQGTDGLVTDSQKVFLTITVADCFPLFFYDPSLKIAGLAHAGWRGTTQNIVSVALKDFVEAYGSSAENIKVAIGPGIKQHHFEIRQDVLPEFSAYQEHLINMNGKIYANLPGILRQQMLDFGLLSANIEESPECTYCSKEKYFSFRRDKPVKLEAMLAFIGMR